MVSQGDRRTTVHNSDILLMNIIIKMRTTVRRIQLHKSAHIVAHGSKRFTRSDFTILQLIIDFRFLPMVSKRFQIDDALKNTTNSIAIWRLTSQRQLMRRDSWRRKTLVRLPSSHHVNASIALVGQSRPNPGTRKGSLSSSHRQPARPFVARRHFPDPSIIGIFTAILSPWQVSICFNPP